MRTLTVLVTAFALLTTAASSLAAIEGAEAIAAAVDESVEMTRDHAAETQAEVWARSAGPRGLVLVAYDNTVFLAETGMDYGFDGARAVVADPDGTTGAIAGEAQDKAAAVVALGTFLTDNFAGVVNADVALVSSIAANALATASEVAWLEQAAVLQSAALAQYFVASCAASPDPAAVAACFHDAVVVWLNAIVEA